jgi:hypothetical protein
MWLENINLLDHSQVNNAYLFLPQFDGTDAVKVFKEKNIWHTGSYVRRSAPPFFRPTPLREMAGASLYLKRAQCLCYLSG